MTVIALHGCKQAPGVTTLALALAAVLDEDGGAIVIDADPQGGDIAALIGRPPTPGLLTLAAAGRHGAPVDVTAHVQRLPSGGGALLAPSEPVQVVAALAALGDRLVGLAATGARHVIVDRGRSDPTGIEEVAVLLCHPTVAGVEQARVRCEAVHVTGAAVVLVTSAAGPYRPDEVGAVLGRPVVASIPRDPRGAEALTGAASTRGLRRSPLVRAATTLADEVRRLAETRAPAW